MAPTKPSTAEYGALLLEREALANHFYDHKLRGEQRLTSGAWLLRLAKLEYRLALATPDLETATLWANTGDSRGVTHLITKADPELIEGILAVRKRRRAREQVFGLAPWDDEPQPWPSEDADMERTRGIDL